MKYNILDNSLKNKTIHITTASVFIALRNTIQPGGYYTSRQAMQHKKDTILCDTLQY